MIKRYFFILFVFAIKNSAYSQITLQHKIFLRPTKYYYDFYFPNKKTSYNIVKSKPQIPLAYNYKSLAFFCKVEVKMEQKFKTPIKFRLGSVNYTDYLEYNKLLFQ